MRAALTEDMDVYSGSSADVDDQAAVREKFRVVMSAIERAGLSDMQMDALLVAADVKSKIPGQSRGTRSVHLRRAIAKILEALNG